MCKEKYSDYLKHIRHPMHVKRLNANITLKDFENLSRRLAKLDRKFSEENEANAETLSKRRIVEEGGSMRAKSMKAIKEVVHEMSTDIGCVE